jgi:pimeloyl-ACP methyl ester carboxylesterase
MYVHVETAGAGDPMLILHGVAASSRTYGPLAPDGFREVRVDFRGHGASDRAPGTYRLEDYVADALPVLEGLGEPAVLVGHSLGGAVAWSVAQRRPKLVRGAFLEDPALYMGEPEEHARNPAIGDFLRMRDEVAAWQADGASEETVAAQLAVRPYPPGDRTAGEALTEYALATRAYALLQLDVEVLDRVIDGSLLASADTTSPVDMPVLVLAADEALDGVLPTRHAARLAASHPSVRVLRLDGAGHSMHDEREYHETLAGHLRRWLDEEALV